MAAGLNQRLTKGLDVGPFDVRDQIAEMIGRDHNTRQLLATPRGWLDDGGYVVAGRRADGQHIEFTGGETRGERRKHVATVKGRADIGQCVRLNDLLAHVIDRRCRLLDHFRQQTIVRRQEGMPITDCEQHAAIGADTRVDHRQMHRAGREVMVGSRYPEAGFGRPVHIGFMGEIDDASRRKATHDHALHGADEGPTMAEVGGHGDDAARLEMLAHVFPIAIYAPPGHCHGSRRGGAMLRACHPAQHGVMTR